MWHTDSDMSSVSLMPFDGRKTETSLNDAYIRYPVISTKHMSEFYAI